MNDMIITAERLTKSYLRGNVATHALRGVSLTIPRGSFTCIVGPSGHGKSTLMHLLGGLDRPTSGSVLLDGIELGKLNEPALAALRARKIGFVFQFFNLLNGLTHLVGERFIFDRGQDVLLFDPQLCLVILPYNNCLTVILVHPGWLDKAHLF